MAASKATYLILWKNVSQVYSSANLETVLKTPIPKGCTEDDKIILQASFLPDEQSLCVYPLTQDQIDAEKLALQTKVEKKASS